MTPQQALQMLRLNPDRAFKECSFTVRYVGNAAIYQNGGRCIAEISNLPNSREENMFLISVVYDQRGSDYFYPYLNGAGGNIGSCAVPKNSPIGTLVFTGGMNGCSLQVNERNAHELTFYHCNNGCAVKDEATLLCRVDFKHYAGPNGVGLEMLKNPKACYYSFNIITVRTQASGGYGWSVYASATQTIDHTNPKEYRIHGTFLADLYKIVSF